MAQGQTDILMYHSISEDAGPTSISPKIFESQMRAIAAANIPVVTMDEVAVPVQSGSAHKKSIAITFDDAFEDFELVAWPILKSLGFGATVYVPVDLVGKRENWDGGNNPPRNIMDWSSIEGLAAQGVCFESHSCTHPDLTKLDSAALEDELCRSRQTIKARLGRPARHFAPPYGSVNAAIIRRISDDYLTSVGTRLGTATPGSQLHDLPRLEMYYFADPMRWNDHLSGRGALYLARRKFFRKMGRAIRSKLTSR